MKKNERMVQGNEIKNKERDKPNRWKLRLQEELPKSLTKERGRQKVVTVEEPQNRNEMERGVGSPKVQ